jgi:type III secretion protein C
MFIFLGILLCLCSSNFCLEEEVLKDFPVQSSKTPDAQSIYGHTINFHEVPIVEFIKFVSKIAGKTFIFNVQDLDFKVSFFSGKASTSSAIINALFQILEQHHFKTKEEADYVLIEKISEQEILAKKKKLLGDLGLADTALKSLQDPLRFHSEGEFHIYKLQYHKGSELLQVIKQVASTKKEETAVPFRSSVDSMQWIESTNSLVFSGPQDVAYDVERLIKSLDTAQKQVFIEVLVIETDAKEASEFGLEWGASGKFKNRLGVGTGNFSQGPGNLFAQSLQSMSATNTPTGASQIPFGRGFDLGVIGDIIFHKGRSFLSLGSLITALQKDGKISVVLNQKIITQDNKNSSIFVGDNIPFTGSVIQTIGASQQTTANIEYRDIGVSLHITPLLGDSDIITLDIQEEITEARDDLRELDARVNGIQTTKTNMATRVHVPDKHFLVLSGMVKNSKVHRKTGIPCLGGIPWIGAAFSKTKVEKEKRNILVFVRPQIIHSFEDYKTLSNLEHTHYNSELDPKDHVNFEKKE